MHLAKYDESDQALYRVYLGYRNKINTFKPNEKFMVLLTWAHYMKNSMVFHFMTIK